MISIIVPVYNSEKTLKRCIESLLAQTYSDIEILLVMDGPVDASIAIGKSYEEKDARIHVLIKENEGVSKARNYGLSHAKGEFIQFVDSDDYVASQLCEKMLGAVDNTNAKMALCGYHHLFLNRDLTKVPKQGLFWFKENPAMFLELYEGGFLNMPWNKLFRKDLIKEGFEETLSLGEDLLFNLTYLECKGKIAVLDEPLYFYVQENGQDTLSSKKRKDKYEIAVRLCNAVKKSYERLLIEAGLSNNKEAIMLGNQIIHKRFILEFLDEIEGLAYDKTMSMVQKLNTIETYMTDAFIIEVSQGIDKLQIDYQVILYFLRKQRKYLVYLLIYIRKICLTLVRGLNR